MRSLCFVLVLLSSPTAAMEPEPEVCTDEAPQTCQPAKGITLPVAIKKVPPKLPRKKVPGTYEVTLRAAINKEGRVEDVWAVAPLADPAYEKEAIKAVKKWEYQPAVDAKGNPVKVFVTFTLTFRL